MSDDKNPLDDVVKTSKAIWKGILGKAKVFIDELADDTPTDEPQVIVSQQQIVPLQDRTVATFVGRAIVSKSYEVASILEAEECLIDELKAAGFTVRD